MLIHSGIAPIDVRLGGMLPGRLHVVSGAPGTGKSLACLEFLNAGLERGEPVALLTHDDPNDLLSQAEFLGVDFEDALRDGRFALVRYQLDFASRFGRTPQPSIAFSELRSLLGGCTPRRIAIDSILPIVDAGTAAGAGIGAMLEFLDGCNATSLLTYPGDFSGRYDRRLEPIVQRAAAVLHLENRSDGHMLSIRKVRFGVGSSAPVTYAIRAGVGLVVNEGPRQRRAEDVPEETRRRLLLLAATTDPAPDELLAALRDRFDVAVRGTEPSALAGPLMMGIILVHARRDGFESALGTVRTLRERGVVAPIAVACSSALRAIDRTRALRAGADDFLDANLRLDELLLRVERLARLGRSAATPSADDTVPGSRELANTVLDERDFRGAVQERIAANGAPFFTVVRLRPSDPRPEAMRTLADATRAHLRAESGDLAGRLDGSVAVFLHAARRKDVGPFVSRVREAWRAVGGGDLDVDMVAFPSEHDALRRMLEGVER